MRNTLLIELDWFAAGLIGGAVIGALLNGGSGAAIGGVVGMLFGHYFDKFVREREVSE